MAAIHLVIYNGVTLGNVEIENFSSEPVYADDGISHETTRHEMSGTALINANTNTSDFVDSWDTVMEDLAAPRGALTVLINDGDTPQPLVNIAEGDDADGPNVTARVTKIIGSRSALVSFNITWHLYEDPTQSRGDASNVNDVLSHRWVQKYIQDRNGYMTWSVVGSLRVRANSATASAIAKDTTDFVGNNPDDYRLSVTPALPAGFRRTKSEYATDESGNKLIYTVEAKEYARDLPKTARSGTGSFTWRRAIRGGDILGKKIFECELVAAPGTGANELLADAIRVSKNRINYGAGSTADLIESISVQELDIFESVKIRLRVVAMASAYSPIQGELNPPNVDLVSDIMKDVEGYVDISPYGTALIKAVRRSIYEPRNLNTDYKKAETEALAQSDADVPTPQVQVPERDFIRLEEEANLQTVFADDSTFTGNHIDFPYTEVTLTESYEVVDTGMVVLGSSRIDGRHEPYQWRPPVVIYTSTAEMKRIGFPPERQWLNPPFGAVMLSQKFEMGGITVDGAGNLIYSARHTRRMQLMDTNSEADGFGVSTLGGENVAVMGWWSPTNSLGSPYDPRREVSSQTNGYDTGRQAYPMPIVEQYLNENTPDGG